MHRHWRDRKRQDDPGRLHSGVPAVPPELLQEPPRDVRAGPLLGDRLHIPVPQEGDRSGDRLRKIQGYVRARALLQGHLPLRARDREPDEVPPEDSGQARVRGCHGRDRPELHISADRRGEPHERGGALQEGEGRRGQV